MFFYNEKFLNNYTEVLSKAFNFKAKIKLFEVDFEKPWWQVITKNKLVFGLTFASETIQAVYSALTPLILGFAVLNQDIRAILGYIAGYAVLEVFNRSVLKQSIVFVLSSSQSIKASAYKFFLIVDPIYHSTKSSGQIISKIDRATSSLEDGINQFLGGIWSIIVGFATVVITVGSFNIWLAVTGILSFVIIISYNYIAVNINLKGFYKKVIKSGDKVSAASVENLQQNALIRSAFATNEQFNKVRAYIINSAISRADFMFGNGISTTIVRLLYITSVSVMSLIVFRLIQSGLMNPTVGVSLIITYLNGSSQILRLGQGIQNLSEKYASIVDLFEFVKNFGKQTYPVLEEDK